MSPAPTPAPRTQAELHAAAARSALRTPGKTEGVAITHALLAIHEDLVTIARRLDIPMSEAAGTVAGAL